MDMPYRGHLDDCNVQFEEGSGTPDGGQPETAGSAIGLSLYPRLMSILTSTSSTGDLEPRVKSIGWVLKLMDGIYDARRRAEQASFAAEEDFFNLDAGSRKHASFPAFAYQHVKNRHGIVHMVRSVCLDLVCNAQFYRSQNPEVEVFARFLEEFYGPKELTFFLDLRAEAHRVARVCAKQKAAAQTVWMTLPDCVRVAKEVFLDKSTLYFRDLIATVEMQMARLPPGGDWPGHDRRRRISLSDFLYLAMVCFVSPKEPAGQGRPRREGPASASGRRVYHGGVGVGVGVGGVGGGGSAWGGSRKMGKARIANAHDDCFDVPSPASYLASGGRRCFRPSPESTSSGGGESDPATIETGQSTARGSVLSFGKKRFVGGDERYPAAAGRGIWETPKALETVAPKEFEASTLERHISMTHNLALETETPEGVRREDGGGSIHSATGGHPAYSGQGTDRLFYAVEGERRGASEEGRRDGNGRLASNTQEAPLAFTSASSGSSACVNGVIGDKAVGDDDKNEQNMEICASGGGGGGGRKALCGPGGGMTVVAGRWPSLAEPDQQLVEDRSSCRRANTGDGGDVKSTDDLRAAACIRLGNATGAGEGAREPKGRETERIPSSNYSAHRQTGIQSAETQPRPRSAAGSVPPPIADALPPYQEDASLIREAPPGGETERTIPRNSGRKPGASGDWDSHRFVENDPGGTWEIGGEVHRQAEISEGRRPGEDQAELDGKADSGDDDSDEPEIRSDVLVMATEWFASFERRFLPSLTGAAVAAAAEASAAGAAAGNNLGTRNGALPAPIARVLSEEMVRVLALRRRDLDAVAHHSPQLLSDAVAKAFRTLEDAVSTASTHSRALCNMGRLLEDRKNADAALLCFQEASAVDTTSAEALCGRARVLQRRGDLQGAAFYFEGALARDESHWPAWYGLGQVKAEQGKHADAAEAFSRWVDGGKTDNGISGERERGRGRAAASHARGLVQLGDAQREIGQDANAQRSYERAIAVDESLPAPVHFKLGSLLQARGGHEAEALDAFARAVRAAGGNNPG